MEVLRQRWKSARNAAVAAGRFRFALGSLMAHCRRTSDRKNTWSSWGRVRHPTAWIAALERSTPAGIGGTSASKMTVVAPSEPIPSSYRLPGDSEVLRRRRHSKSANASSSTAHTTCLPPSRSAARTSIRWSARKSSMCCTGSSIRSVRHDVQSRAKCTERRNARPAALLCPLLNTNWGFRATLNKLPISAATLGLFRQARSENKKVVISGPFRALGL